MPGLDFTRGSDEQVVGRICPQCGQQLWRREREDEYAFARRVYCTKRCFRDSMRRKKAP